jgi:DNA-binding IclR family transcriptional regulator
MQAISGVAPLRFGGHEATYGRWLDDTAADGRESPLGAVEKADLVLGSFPCDRDHVGVSELARRSGLAKSTTHRVLQVLETIGMVVRHPDGYQLGHRLHELADIAGGRRPSQIRDCVLPHLLDLYERTHLTVHLGVWTCGEILIAERLHGRNGRCLPPRIGARVTAQSSALGLVLLAYADETAQWQARKTASRSPGLATPMSHIQTERELRAIRREGVVVSPDPTLPGVFCVAAPIWGPRRSVLAAISASGSHHGMDTSVVVGHVRRAAYAARSACCTAERLAGTSGGPA